MYSYNKNAEKSEAKGVDFAKLAKRVERKKHLYFLLYPCATKEDYSVALWHKLMSDEHLSRQTRRYNR